jgi:hypothetical protein
MNAFISLIWSLASFQGSSCDEAGNQVIDYRVGAYERTVPVWFLERNLQDQVWFVSRIRK